MDYTITATKKNCIILSLLFLIFCFSLPGFSFLFMDYRHLDHRVKGVLKM